MSYLNSAIDYVTNPDNWRLSQKWYGLWPFRKIDDLTEENRRLMEIAYNDPVTGLGNRLALDEALEYCMNDTDESANSGSSLVLFDLDNFKNINDNFGHAEGDKALRMVGEALQSSMRHGDETRPGDTLTSYKKGGKTAARQGGDEFALLCPDIGFEGTAFLTQDLARRVTEKGSIQPYNPPLGASVGAAFWPRTYGKPELDDFREAADRAVYRVKSPDLKGTGSSAIWIPNHGILVCYKDGPIVDPRGFEFKPAEVEGILTPAAA